MDSEIKQYACKFRIYFGFFFLFFTFTGILHSSEVIGWYDPFTIANNVLRYSLASSQTNANTVFIVSSGMESEFNEKTSSVYNLRIHKFDGGSAKSYPVATVTLSPSRFRFSINATAAVSETSIMVVWQEPKVDKVGSRIMYTVAERSTMVFSEPKEFSDAGSVSLPHVHVDYKGDFHLFYQAFVKTKQGLRFIIRHNKYERNSFNRNSEDVVNDPGSIGRGVFFPAIIMDQSSIHILFQSKRDQTLKDEIYYILSTNLGKSYSDPIRMTNNDINDFSPMGAITNERMEWVWQADSETGYNVFLFVPKETPVNVSLSNTNSYNPVLAYEPSIGRIAAWYDFRQSPPQIYARFLQKGENTLIGQPHPATDNKTAAFNPALAIINKHVYLFYLSGGVVYARMADVYASEIKITSRTHAKNKYSNSDKVVFELEMDSEPSGVASFSYLIDNRPDSIPDLANLRGESREIEKSGLESGQYYLHIKYVDKAGNQSGVYRYPFLVDTEGPSPPEIVSDTHVPSEASNNTTFHATFSSSDNVGVKGYRYVISNNIGEEPSNFTGQGEVSLENLEPGKYFLLVKGEDNAGNLSATSIFQIDIRYPDEDDFTIETNIKAGNVNQSILQVSLTMQNPSKKILKLEGAALSSKLEAAKDWNLIPSDKTENVFSSVIDLNKFKPGFYVLNIRAVYDDGTKSHPRYLYFLYTPPGFTVENQAKLHPGRRLTFVPKNALSLKPVVNIESIGQIYEVSFSLPEKMQKKYNSRLMGFSYELSRSPREPSGRLNYGKTPIYFYNLSPGVYYITVVPVFAGNKTEPDTYSFVRFEIPQPPLVSIAYQVILLLAGVLIVIIILNRKKIGFYISRF